MHAACLAVIWVGFSWVALTVSGALYLARMFAITGFFLWYGERDTRFRLPNALLVHDWLMYASFVLFVGHLYLALILPRTRHSLSGMTRGWVREDWAERRHPKWVERVRAENDPGPG